MKSMFCLVGCCLLAHVLCAQASVLPLTTNKTTSLVFPFPVRHVDRGTADVLVQGVKSAENILLVKAACAGFAETNLSVVTEDGSLYSFRVVYQTAPDRWTFELPAKGAPSPSATAARIKDLPPALTGVRNRTGGVTLALEGLYISGRTLFCRLQLHNDSPLDYPLDYLRFSLRDRGQARRTARQERELPAVLRSGPHPTVKAHGSQTLILSLEAFTLSPAQYLSVEAGESGGGHRLALKVKNRHLLKARPLDESR